MVIRIDAELDESSVDDVFQSEERIVNQSRDLSAETRSDIQQELDEDLHCFGLQTRLVVVEKSNSLALYFICLTLFALMRLRNQWNSGKLRDIVQSVCSFFLYFPRARLEVLVKRLLWSQTDYERSEEFLSSLPGKLIISQ